MKYLKIISSTLFIVILSACQENKTLPIIGPHTYNDNDTIYYTIPSFSMERIDGEEITKEKMTSHVYLADFFFSSCPSICPVMNRNLIDVHKALKEDERFKIVSHTLDPEYDTPEVLNEYANKRKIDQNGWYFVRNSRQVTYNLAEKGYFITAGDDSLAPGGIMHAGRVILVDRKGRIRGYYNATDKTVIPGLIDDIEILIAEQF